jgi:rhodanese-related sulfurtransferase
MKTKLLTGLVFLSLLLAPLGTALAAAPEVKLIDAATLKGMLGDPQLLVIDVRTPSAYADSDKKIKTAVRQDPGKVPTWAQKLSRDQKMVLYCS